MAEDDAGNERLQEAAMTSIRRVTVILALIVSLVMAFGSAATAGGRPFTIPLSGANEVSPAGVPNQGDPDGSGTAVLTVNPGQEEVCWTIDVTGVEPITAAHIHVAPVTAPGPVVVPLSPSTGGCVHVDRALARALITSPDDYYVNVHNVPYPSGALRGQLGR
jgi:CHRD domain